MDTTENKEVAQVEDVLTTAGDPTKLEEPATVADGSANPTDTTGDGDATTTAEAPAAEESETSETTATDADDTTVEEVSDEEIARLQKQLDNLTKKVELTRKLREQTKALLDMGAVLHNTDDVVTPEDMAEETEPEAIPDIADTVYVDQPEQTTDEEDE